MQTLNSPKRRRRLFRLLPLPFLCIALSSNGQPHADHDHDHDHEPEHEHEGADGHGDAHGGEGALVQIDPTVLDEFGIETGIAGPGILHEQVVLPGEIHFNRDRMAQLTARLAGTVTEIHARVGDVVRRGDVLAVLESTETLRPFNVAAALDGTVVENNLSLGQSVEAGAALFSVADLSLLWADLRIYQRELAAIRAGQPVVIEGSHHQPVQPGVIAWVAPTVDRHTRTGLARVLLDNGDGAWRPGQFIRGRVSLEEHAVAVRVPRTALLTLDDRTVVFVQTDRGFAPRPVTLGHSDREAYEVLHGLHAGERIVVRNPLPLKAELGKDAFGGHEGHAH